MLRFCKSVLWIYQEKDLVICLYSTKSNNIVLSQKYGVKPGKKSTAIGYK